MWLQQGGLEGLLESWPVLVPVVCVLGVPWGGGFLPLLIPGSVCPGVLIGSGWFGREGGVWM